MVKTLVSFLLLFSFTALFSAETTQADLDPLTSKIQSLLSKENYENNREFINVIFEPKSAYYKKDRLDSVKVVSTLKDNGLLKLFFDSPQELKLNFKTNGSPLFFVKIMGDTLRNMGYYRYVTRASNLDNSEFTWNIVLTSEYATDPVALQMQLKKSGSKIIDIERFSANEWTYVIDIDRGYLDIKTLRSGKVLKLRRSLYSHWLNISKIHKLTIQSSKRNKWYPYIAYYDSSLHLLKVLKEDKITKKIVLDIPTNAKYVKISDLYTLKNVKDELHLYPSGSK